MKRCVAVHALLWIFAAAATAEPPPAGKGKKGGNEDLIEMGRGLLDDDDAPAKKSHHHGSHRHHGSSSTSSAPAPAAPATPPPLPSPAPAPVPAGAAAPVVIDAGVAPAAPDLATPPDLLAPVAVDAAPPGDLLAAAPVVAVAPRDMATAPPPPAKIDEPPTSPPTTTAPHVHSASERVKSGANLPMQGATQSPLARMGIPAQAVPAVATAVTVGTMALWPFLMKTLMGLLKGLFGAFLKNRAKKDKKIDKDQREFVLFGFRFRPRELASLLLGASIYGLAVSYTLKGWKLDRPFLAREEALVIAIYYSRSFIRFFWERLFGLATQYRLWLGGGLLCLGSAYLGNTLGTVGYELEGARTPEETQRILRMKAWLIVVALAMAVGLCVANLYFPNKVLQSGRVMTSGMALGEVMPITPMPGLKIFRWRKSVWALLFVLVVPTFFLVNFVL